MKSTVFIAITLVLSGISANAANLQTNNLEKMIGNQHYQKLLKNFDKVERTPADRFQHILDLAHQGQSASFADVEGVYTGRCYDMVNRKRPLSSALLITQLTTNEGPLFPTEKVVIEGGDDGAADAFDSMTKETLISELMVLKSGYSNVVESPLSVVLLDTKTTSHKITFFKNQNYILSLTSANQNQEIHVLGNGIINVKKRDVWMACYYFNKK